MMETKKVSINFDSKLYKRLESDAKVNNKTMEEFVQSICADYIHEMDVLNEIYEQQSRFYSFGY